MDLERSKMQEMERLKESLSVGMIFFDSRGEQIIRITKIEEKKWKENTPSVTYYSYDRLVDLEKDEWNEYGHSSFEDLKRYYRIQSPIKDIKDLYNQAKDAQINGVPKYEQASDFEQSTELVAMNSKENLLAMRDQIEVFQNQRQQLELMLNYQLCEVREKFDLMRKELQGQLSVMMRQVEKIMRVVRVIELYLGIEEDLFQLQSGEGADKEEPLSLRQQILYMDEEVGIIENQGIDFTEIEKFDEWLLKDKHYETLLPEKRSIVVFKPRRYGKKYTDAYDRTYEDRDPRNKMPYFLIRDGENLYRIHTDKMTLPERLFPKKKEFQEMIDKINMNDGKLSELDKDKVEDFSYLYQRIVFFIQGLIDRTEVFGTMSKKVNLMKMEESDRNIRLIYDDELCFPTGRLPFSEWKSNINSFIEEGSRILWCANVGTWESNRNRINRYFKDYNEWSIPDRPGTGVYEVEEKKVEGWSQGELKERSQLYFKYFPGGSYWSPSKGYVEKQNKVSFKIDRSDAQVLHYDRIDLDTIEFYIHSRLDRANYLEYLPVLKTIRKYLLKEQKEEDQFCLMLIGECQKRGLTPKIGMTYEKIIKELIDWWKYKAKWKRPINKDDELAMRMIERRLFAVTNKRKWFK